jgi:hypothetical protein
MADEKRQIILDLLARNKMRKDTNEAADDLDKLGKSAEEADKKTESLGKTSEETTGETDKLGESATKASQETDKLGESAKKAGTETDKLGNNADHTRGKMAQLSKEIELSKKELAALAGSFASAGSSAEKNDISKAMRRTEADIKKNLKSINLLQEILPDSGQQSQFANSFKDLFGGIGDIAVPALVTGIAAAAPAIGAVVSGAIVGTVGLAGIAGGLVLAFQNGKVQDAAARTGQYLEKELTDAAKPFVPVAINGINQVRKAVDTINFKQVFSDAAQQAGPLIDGLTTFVEGLGKGIATAIHNSGPEVAALGKGIGQIGDALGNGLAGLSRNSKEGADALSNLFTVVTGGIDAIFGLIDGLTTVYGFLRKIGGPGLVDGLRAYDEAATPVAGKLTDIATNTIEAANGTADLAKEQDVATRAAEGQRAALDELSKQLRAQTDPAFALLDATDKVAAAHKEAADAAHKYGSNSDQAREASRHLAEAAIDLEGKAGDVATTFDGHLSPSLRATLKSAGLTKSEIKNVESELKRAKKAADAYAQNYQATVTTVYVEKSYQVGGSDYNREANRGSFSKRAAGGPVVRGVPYLVGENGPEIMMPDDSGRIISAAGSRGLMLGAGIKGMTGSVAGGGGGFSGPLELKVAPGADQAVATLINGLIRKNMIQISVASA